MVGTFMTEFLSGLVLFDFYCSFKKISWVPICDEKTDWRKSTDLMLSNHDRATRLNNVAMPSIPLLYTNSTVKTFFKVITD